MEMSGDIVSLRRCQRSKDLKEAKVQAKHMSAKEHSRMVERTEPCCQTPRWAVWQREEPG